MKPYTLADAEAALQRAIDACRCPRTPCLCGAARSAAALATHIDRLQDRLQGDEATPTLGGSALWYAQHGHPVFPITPGAKKPPLTRHGLHDATTVTEQIQTWWRQWPTANIGLATGHHFDVVDIDGPEGQATRTHLWDALMGELDAAAIAKVITPRPGGMHLYIPADPDTRNGASLGPKVDTRGRGGYVLAPPSTLLPGGDHSPGIYRFLGTPALTSERG